MCSKLMKEAGITSIYIILSAKFADAFHYHSPSLSPYKFFYAQNVTFLVSDNRISGVVTYILERYLKRTMLLAAQHCSIVSVLCNLMHTTIYPSLFTQVCLHYVRSMPSAYRAKH